MNNARNSLRNALIDTLVGLDSINTRLLLRVVTPSDAMVLAQWIRNAAEHLKAANELLGGLPKKGEKNS